MICSKHPANINIKMDYYEYYGYSALGPVGAETRAQSGDWNGSGTLHSGQILRGSLPLLSPMGKAIKMDNDTKKQAPKFKYIVSKKCT